MASTYTNIGTELMTTGENAGNWGTKTNTNIQILEEAIRGYVAQSIAGGAQTTALTYSDGSTGDTARNAVIALTGSITGNQVVTVTAKEKWWIIDNQTSGAYTVQVLVSGQTGVTWATTDKGTKILYCNGTDVVDTGISSNKFAPDSADGEALGSSSKEFSDLYLADSSVIYFGNDQDTTLTHTDGTGLTLNSANKLLFRDSALSISSSTDGQLDIDADTEVEIATTTVDLNGALDVSGASQFSGAITTGVDDTGVDVKFFGATSGSFLLWDESDDALELTDSSPIKIGDGGDMQVYHDGSNSYVTNSTGALKLATETSGIAVTIGHTTSEVTVADNLTVTGTLTLGSGAELTEAELEFLDGITAGTAAASKAMVLDSSADITGGRNLTISGELDAATLDISGNADIDGTANLDAVDIDGAVQIDGAVTVGVDGTGLDVKFFGDTAGSFLLWDQSADALLLTDSTPIQIGDAQDLTLYHDGSNSYITNAVGALKIATETSGIAVTIGHTTSETTIADNATITGNLSVGGNFDVTGTIDLSDSDFTNAGDIQLDSITGDGDTNTSITFSGSDVITVTTGGETQITFNNGSILPTTDDDIDLGSASYQFKNGYFDGTLEADAITVGGTNVVTAGADTSITSIYNTSLAIGYGSSHANIDFSTDNSIIFDIDGTQQITLADGVLKPVTDNDVDLGTSGLEFKDGYFDGTLHCDVLDLNGTEHTTIEDPTALAIALG
jgi:cytoskeletal protein CcmA (bactofilin family)